MEEILYLPCDEGTVNGRTWLKGIRNYDYSDEDHMKWIIMHAYREENEEKGYVYDITRNSCELDAITVKAGDVVTFMHMVDSDGDGLSHRLESAMGTSDDKPDTCTTDKYKNDYEWFISGHPLPDNPDQKYRLTYNGNGSNGGIKVCSDTYSAGDTVPFSNPGRITRINVWDKDVEKNASYHLTGWTTEPDGSGTVYNNDTQFVMGSRNANLYAKWEEYKPRDIGPGGGYIFYIKDYYSDGWRYMEAGPVDIGNKAIFRQAYNAPLVTSRFIGTGKQNTKNIEDSDTAIGIAADLCTNYRGGGYADWFLPSDMELYQMGWNLVGVGKDAAYGLRPVRAF